MDAGSFDATPLQDHTVGVVHGARLRRKPLPRGRRWLLLGGVALLAAGGALWASHAVGDVAPIAIAGAGLLGCAAAYAWQTHFVVGTDGLFMGGSLYRRFVPMRDVDHAELDERYVRRRDDREGVRVGTVAVHLRSGESVTFSDRAIPRAAALVERINASVAAHARVSSPPRAVGLGCAGLAAPQWVQNVRSATTLAASPHRATLADEQLWQMAEDSTLGVDERAAAAAALGWRAPSDAAPRLLRQARATALPELRDVFASAAARDEAAIERSLVALRGEVPER
ncbi:MAG: hypothetical protein HY908_34625 [Myxococcales bacterium]|nr:hypothetical protein [Myxococcales bacterium]